MPRPLDFTHFPKSVFTQAPPAQPVEPAPEDDVPPPGSRSASPAPRQRFDGAGTGFVGRAPVERRAPLVETPTGVLERMARPGPVEWDRTQAAIAAFERRLDELRIDARDDRIASGPARIDDLEAALRAVTSGDPDRLATLCDAVARSGLSLAERLDLALLPALTERPSTGNDPVYLMLAGVAGFSEGDLRRGLGVVEDAVARIQDRPMDAGKLLTTYFAAIGRIAETSLDMESRQSAAEWLDDMMHQLGRTLDALAGDGSGDVARAPLLADEAFVIRCANRNLHHLMTNDAGDVVCESIAESLDRLRGGGRVDASPAKDIGLQIGEMMTRLALTFPKVAGASEPSLLDDDDARALFGKMFDCLETLQPSQIVDALAPVRAVEELAVSDTLRLELENRALELINALPTSRQEALYERLAAMRKRKTLSFETALAMPA